MGRSFSHNRRRLSYGQPRNAQAEEEHSQAQYPDAEGHDGGPGLG